jgi:hypothetical protein
MEKVKRAIRRCVANRPVSRKKNVVSTVGRATMERIRWLARMEMYSDAHRVVARENRVRRAVRGSRFGSHYWNNSADARESARTEMSGLIPTVTSTLPSGNKTAACLARALAMSLVGMKLLLAGSNSSAVVVDCGRNPA